MNSEIFLDKPKFSPLSTIILYKNYICNMLSTKYLYLLTFELDGIKTPLCQITTCPNGNKLITVNISVYTIPQLYSAHKSDIYLYIHNYSI